MASWCEPISRGSRGAIATAIRTRFLAIPSTAAPLISCKATPSENEAMLRQLVDDALGDLSGAEITFKDEPEDIPAGERV